MHEVIGSDAQVVITDLQFGQVHTDAFHVKWQMVPRCQDGCHLSRESQLVDRE